MKSVAALGDVEDINTWSNIPFFFYSSGKKAGLFNKAWNVDVSRFGFDRKLWNLKEILLLRGPGGFQYSDQFLNAIESQISRKLFSTDVITFNQHFPRYSSVQEVGGSLYHYIDAPFLSIVESSFYRASLPERKIKMALQLEKANYRGSKAIVTMASWAAKELIEKYDVNPEKVFTIMPGANLTIPNDFSFRNFTSGAGSARPFRLGFIGKDWKRKGLDTVHQIGAILSSKGYKVAIDIIGFSPSHINKDPMVNYHGFVDKHTMQLKFIEILSFCDLGCVFSLDEAFGISTLEFLILGVPVAGFLDKGLIDTIPPDAGFGFKPGTPVSDIAEKIESFIKDENMQQRIRSNAQRWSNYVTWERCVNDWAKKIFINDE